MLLGEPNCYGSNEESPGIDVGKQWVRNCGFTKAMISQKQLPTSRELIYLTNLESCKFLEVTT